MNRLIYNCTAGNGKNRWVSVNDETGVATCYSSVYLPRNDTFEGPSKEKHNIVRMQNSVIEEPMGYTDEADLRKKARAWIKGDKAAV